MAHVANPYGDGRAAARIVERLVTDLALQPTDQPDGSPSARGGRSRYDTGLPVPSAC